MSLPVIKAESPGINTTGLIVHLMEPLWPMVDNCCMCDAEVPILTFGPNYGIPMWCGIPVAPENTSLDGEWGGFCACKACFDKYERREFRMWL